MLRFTTPQTERAVETPLDPNLRLLLIALRRALLIVADALGEYCRLEKRQI